MSFGCGIHFLYPTRKDVSFGSQISLMSLADIFLTVRINRGPVPDDILLGDYTDQEDNDASGYD